ncbi:glycosyltransferase [Gluconacetobacter entanii]|uniref:glycosyltransferase n=1 Tax=Gluconacetobacter entanii TaxID=108528 RepID=UPI001C9354FB|nr:glycosyltransferase [Gluconacetobacter entanii]MBY4640652.1 glycosyltransferase [Gluconacetobacter entanii]MCW4578923.1 glycosyltransferase [Gluconacetobacter entanii]MCW4582316.1 glycosyltransferase [Gluconacetobacter entanii]
MRIYYFLDKSQCNTEYEYSAYIAKNIGKSLRSIASVQLQPVEWDEDVSELLHAGAELCKVFGFSSEATDSNRALQQGGVRWSGAQKSQDWLVILGISSEKYATLLPKIIAFAYQKGIRVCVLLYDLIESFSDNTEKDSILMTMALSYADIVMPASQSLASDLTQLYAKYGISYREKRIVYPILFPNEVPDVPALCCQKEDNSSYSSFAFVMCETITERNNQVRVMQAFNEIFAEYPDLDLELHHVGDIKGKYVEIVSRLVRLSKGRIKLHGPLPFSQVNALIQKSQGTICVPCDAGYSIALTRSLWMGQPCIVSSLPALTEICKGKGVIFADPQHVPSIKNAILKISTNKEAYNTLKKQLSKFHFKTWNYYAENLEKKILKSENNIFLKENLKSKLIKYTPWAKPVSKKELEFFNIPMDIMHIPGEWDAFDPRLFHDKYVEYIKEFHKDCENNTLCYGPYRKLPFGNYFFEIEGEIKGDCILKITANFGRDVYFRNEINDFSKEIELKLESDIENMEIVICKTLSLDYLRVENFNIIRCV